MEVNPVCIDTLRPADRAMDGTETLMVPAGAKRTLAWRPLSLLVPGLIGPGLLTSCSWRSAPAAVLFGAYFPDWLLFGMLAIASAVIARVVAGLAGFAQAVPFPLFTFLAVGVLVAGAFDLLWLGR